MWEWTNGLNGLFDLEYHINHIRHHTTLWPGTNIHINLHPFTTLYRLFWGEQGKMFWPPICIPVQYKWGCNYHKTKVTRVITCYNPIMVLRGPFFACNLAIPSWVPGNRVGACFRFLHSLKHQVQHTKSLSQFTSSYYISSTMPPTSGIQPRKRTHVNDFTAMLKVHRSCATETNIASMRDDDTAVSPAFVQELWAPGTSWQYMQPLK